jgi:dolichyldiphosphatase
VTASRVYLRYHTLKQVITGSCIGVILGMAWYIAVWVLRRTGWVDWLLQWPVLEMLWFKDGDIGSLEHDLEQEWREWRRLHFKANGTSSQPMANGLTTKKKK